MKQNLGGFSPFSLSITANNFGKLTKSSETSLSQNYSFIYLR